MIRLPLFVCQCMNDLYRLYRGALLSIILVVLSGSCTIDQREITQMSPRFKQIDPSVSGLNFTNELSTDSTFNVFLYRNYYNGGGVAIGDVDGDGLEDIFLTSNKHQNKLYKNLGNLKFRDITESAGIAGSSVWSTGVSMADVDGDGDLDVYVCSSGDIDGGNKRNELFINDGDGHFADLADSFGLGDTGFSTHASFFDYDHDGDLDCYILNNSFRPISTLGLRNVRSRRDREGGDKLMRNDDGRFVDVSEKAGIFGSVIGFGLGVSVGDVTGDGWEDIYVSNDFYERDYLYVNNRDGTFKEDLPRRIQSLSQFSMGADIADLDNDALPEIFVTDMLPGDDRKLQRTTKFASPNEYQLRLDRGFHHQVMRNTLQYNLGDGTFAEVGQALGVSATDWSWGALLVDLDNNGYRDIFVCNGVYKDVTDQDFINFMSNDATVARVAQSGGADFSPYVDLLQSHPIANVSYANLNGTRLVDSSEAWGFDRPSFSNGAAYADLDHDGDYDLVINDLGSPVQLLKNTTVERGGPTGSRLIFKGVGDNPRALGVTVRLYYEDRVVYYEHLPVRGFQSSVTYTPLATLPEGAKLDSAIFLDPYGRRIVYLDGPLPDSLVVDFNAVEPQATPLSAPKQTRSLTHFVTDEVLATPLLHTEDTYNEFDRDPLLYWTNAADGPAFACSVDDDGLTRRLYIGGSAGAPGRLLTWNEDISRYDQLDIPSFVRDRAYEDVVAVFLDFDQDGDDDLLVGSGGSEYFGRPTGYPLRLYEWSANRNGQFSFVRITDTRMPSILRPISDMVVRDLNDDGYPEVLISSRISNEGYGSAKPISILMNSSAGFSPPVSLSGAQSVRFVSAIELADVDGDGVQECVAVGEFMPITMFFTTATPFDSTVTIPGTEGLYRSLLAIDLDGDTRDELVCGNFGTNTFLSANNQSPLYLYHADFDGNGTQEPIFAHTVDDEILPYAGKHELERLIPSVKQRFLRYADYAGASLREVFPTIDLDTISRREATEFRSLVAQYDKRKWQVEALPQPAQRSVVFASAALKGRGNQVSAVLLGGNLYGNQPRLGSVDGSRGELLSNSGGDLSYKPGISNLRIYGQVRHLKPMITPAGKPVVAVVKNQGQLEFISAESLSGPM